MLYIVVEEEDLHGARILAHEGSEHFLVLPDLILESLCLRSQFDVPTIHPISINFN